MGSHEAQRLADFSRAVRELTVIQLRSVPKDRIHWRPVDSAMSFADITQHLIDADDWLFDKIRDRIASIFGQMGIDAIDSFEQFEDCVGILQQLGAERAAAISLLSDSDLSRRIYNERSDSEVTIWSLVVRGNLEHEAHHRGQIAAYLRMLSAFN